MGLKEAIERKLVMDAIKQFLKTHSAYAHTITGVFLALMLVYARVPQFAALCNHLYSQTPSWLHEWILAVIGVLVWYSNTHKEDAILGIGQQIPSTAQELLVKTNKEDAQ